VLYYFSCSVALETSSLTVMDKWVGKTAVVTGASAGIGAEIVKDLARNGINVIGLARRPKKIEEIADELGEVSGKISAFKCDVSDLQSIKDAFKTIEEKIGVIHILINNAGVLKNIKILSDEDSSEQINEIINTNFAGLVHVTHEAYRLMKRANDYGMIINVNSNAGHKIPFPFSQNMSHNVYHGTKFAVTATSEVLRQELICQNNDKIRVTVIFFTKKSS
jgi:NADP+-dependent farnesol dehydrogenase